VLLEAFALMWHSHMLHERTSLLNKKLKEALFNKDVCVESVHEAMNKHDLSLTVVLDDEIRLREWLRNDDRWIDLSRFRDIWVCIGRCVGEDCLLVRVRASVCLILSFRMDSLSVLMIESLRRMSIHSVVVEFASLLG